MRYQPFTTTLAPSPRLRVALAVASIALAAHALAHAASTANPAAPRVEVTGSGWHEKPSKVSGSVQSGQFQSDPTFFELFVHPVSDFTDLMGYARNRRALFAKGSKLGNRQQTEAVKRQVAGRETVEFEVTGESNGSLWHYRFINLRVGDSYCTLECSVKPSRWAAAQPQLDLLVKNLK